MLKVANTEFQLGTQDKMSFKHSVPIYRIETFILAFSQTMQTFYQQSFRFKLFFSLRIFFHEHSRFTGHQWKEKTISLTPLYHFNPLHRYLDISRAITAESTPLHVASSWTQTGNLGFRAQVANR